MFAAGGVDPINIYLENGDKYLGEQQWDKAVENLQNAAATHRLNDLGLTQLYWKLFIAYDVLKDIDNAALSLIKLKACANDFLRLAVKGESGYTKAHIKEFKIRGKLTLADILLQAWWASKTEHTCRSKLFACSVDEESSIDLFRLRVPFCDKPDSWPIQTIYSKDDEFIKVNVTCFDKTQEHYYFIIKKTEP